MLPPEDIGISAIVDTKSTDSAAYSAAKDYKSLQEGSTLSYQTLLTKKSLPSKESRSLEVTARLTIHSLMDC